MLFVEFDLKKKIIKIKIFKGEYEKMIREIDLTKKGVMKRVRYHGSPHSRKVLKAISYILNLDIVKIVGRKMNREYENTDGLRPAYDRVMLIGVELFCREKKISTYYGIEREIQDNSALMAFVDYHPPKYTTISNFLKEISETWLKEIFYRHLVLINDYDPLNFEKVFIDGTDVIANASINYTINEKQIDAIKLLYEWRLLHNGNKENIKKTIEILKEKLDEYENNEKIYNTIQIALKRPQIYTYKNYERIEKIQKILKETEKKSVSISFPEGVIIKTKKGRFDVGFNLQLLMLNNHLILAGYLTRTSNDENVMQIILDELKKDLKLFVEIMEKYGENTENIDKLKNLLENVTFICDSGYFTNDNIEACFIENVELIVMSKQAARQENNKKREKWYEKIQDVKTHKSDKVSKKLCIRIKNGYICPFKRKILLTRQYKTNSKFNKNLDTTDELLYEYCYVHECEDCTGCPYLEKYGKPCDCATINDRVTKFKYETTNEFVEGIHKEVYKDRIHISERVNAFLKGLTGMYHVKGRDYKSAKNQVLLADLLHNMIRFENIKDTYY